MEQLVKDLRYSLRAVRRNPTFTLTAIATLALGIGASTAMFSVVNAVLLRPLPYPEPDRLALVFWENRANGSKSFQYSNADFADLRGGLREIFEDMGGVTSFRAFVTREDGSAEQISKALVTTNFFRLMGASIAVGRDFTDADAVPQPAQEGVLIPPGSAAILSYEYWQRRYGGNLNVLGQAIAGGPRIVGVLSPGFRLFFPAVAVGRIDAAPDFFVANNIGYDAAHRNLITTGAIGRLRSGVSVRRAQDRLTALRAEVRKHSFDPEATLRLVPIQSYLVEEVRPAILALMGAVVFLLLIACANVANLMLVRASTRERELAVRSALGGSWWRLVQQMMAEAAWLAGAGTALGVGLAWIGIRAVLRMAPDLPRLESAGMNWRVFVFAAVAGAAATALFGVVPAIRAARPDVNRILRGGRASMERAFLRNAVVVIEVALSFVLLVGSGLMLRSFLELRRVDPGYDPRGVLTFFVTRDWSFTRQQGRIELLNRIQASLQAIPGVESASGALMLPLGGGASSKKGAASRPDGASWETADYQQVMPAYFETLHTRLIAGRTFTPKDNAPGRNLAVVDQFFAERAFPTESAVGKRIPLPGPGNPWAEVIGVVKHQRLFSLSDPGRETLYLTDGFWGIGASRYWLLRTVGDPSKYAAAARAEIARVDPQLVVSKMQSMEALVERDQSGARFSLFLIGGFAAIALLLACVGLYGVLATVVRQRTAEIGVRMALGAEPARIFRLVVGHGLRLSVCGIAIGLIAAAGLTRMIAAMLVGVTATDPFTFSAMTAVFLMVAALASWIPAARAAGLDPMAALREQ